MPVDRCTATVVVHAPFEAVLAAVRDVAAQPRWAKEITEAELLEEYEDGTPATAAFTMVSKLGTDRYTLEYEHGDDHLAWTLVEAEQMKAQDGSYRLRPLADGTTEVTLTLTVDHAVHAPGFVRRAVFGRYVDSLARELKTHLEA